jgi:hypothetical protein
MESVKDYMDKKAVAQVLEQIAAFLELKNENPFRVRAFRTAARAISTFPHDLRESLDDGSLALAKGVGPATLQIVAELVRTGRASMLEELREQIPPGLVEMLEISGLGVAKIRQIHQVLGIDSLPELEADSGRGPLKMSSRPLPSCDRLARTGSCTTRPTKLKRCEPHSNGCPALPPPPLPAMCAAARRSCVT